jgi:hypothetical protein
VIDESTRFAGVARSDEDFEGEPNDTPSPWHITAAFQCTYPNGGIELPFALRLKTLGNPDEENYGISAKEKFRAALAIKQTIWELRNGKVTLDALPEWRRLKGSEAEKVKALYHPELRI